jgi:hypothetical protein
MAETKTELSTPKAALSPAAAEAVLDRLGRIEASRVGDPSAGDLRREKVPTTARGMRNTKLKTGRRSVLKVPVWSRVPRCS